MSAMSLENLRNVGTSDRVIRTVCGAVLVGLAYFGPHLLQDGLVVGVVWTFGVINLVTGLSGYCLVYQVAGINTAHH